IRMLEIAPGHHTPDSCRGNPKPLSLSSAFTTPPNPPKREINDAHIHGFIATPPLNLNVWGPKKSDEILLHDQMLRNIKVGGIRARFPMRESPRSKSPEYATLRNPYEGNRCCSR